MTARKNLNRGRKELTYGSANLIGYLGYDQVCLSKKAEACVSDFEFFVMNKQDGLSGYDGILGLSPPNEVQNGPSYVKALFEQNVIPDEVVTFWLNLYSDEGSYVTFGGVPENSTRGSPSSQDLI